MESPLAPGQIRALRLQIGETPTEFAVRFGVTEQTVRNWESGARRPGPTAMKALHALHSGPATVGVA